MTDKYILVDGEPVPEPDLFKWGAWLQEHNDERRVAYDTVTEGVTVSTVFLGLDHSFHDGGPPILFETMVFGGELDQEQDRYSTKQEALDGHARMLAKVRGMAY